MKVHIQHLHDSFVDYKGKTHYLTLVAISEELPIKNCELKNPVEEYNPDNAVTYDVCEYLDNFGCLNYIGEVTKGLKIGISVCNPLDKFDPEIGLKRATAKAKQSNYVLFVTDKGLINTALVTALLHQEAEFIKNNPNKIIKGYNEAMKKYQKQQEEISKMKTFKKNLSENERIAVKVAKENPGFLHKLMSYVEWLKK